MKKMGYLLLSLLLVGCGTKELMNTPTKKVEMFLSSYQSLDEKVIEQLNTTAKEEEDFNTEQREEYIEIFKKHYKELTYDIKDEVVDGDEATVTVEIEVTDYSKIMSDAEDHLTESPDEFKDEEGIYDKSLFTGYRIKQLKEAKERVKYTLDVTLTKVDDVWKINDLSKTDRMKIHGLYQY